MREEDNDVSSELTLEKIIAGYGAFYGRNESVRTSKINESFGEMTTELRASLYNVKQPMYNQGAFDKVISSIELNGITNFNMTTFWGKISAALDRNYNNTPETPINQLVMHYEECAVGGGALDSLTNSFNCDSVGCIAGFAMAEAVKWIQPDWITEDSRNYLDAFEGIACAYLNIPFEVGETIFYGGPGCVWGFVKFFEPENYGSIEWEDGSELDCYNCESQSDWKCESVELSTISYKAATDVLRRIANGEILIDYRNDFTPRYANHTVENKLVENA